ncbi:hypothetical protein EV182_001136 [Spiromyces aspiralis]|uniref:Uncharacterized protein n=1 Tax=Spiromyces aspiralis TaxID=68401 RepID=A0ACC1HJK3_9FUNG|nr:hypothetical protein EV182_001136 [Spiromyces aspiralis]
MLIHLVPSQLDRWKFRVGLADILSSCDCFDELLDDPYHICWSLDPVEKARSVDTIRRATPCVRIPPRYRSTSLKPLTIEYRMMKAAKKPSRHAHFASSEVQGSPLREQNKLVAFLPKIPALY